MPGIARIGDIGQGVCPNHHTPQPYTTVFTSGSETVFINELGACFTGTIGIATCGHPTIALTGSPDVTSEGISIHRTGDMGINFGPYIVLNGSDDTTSN